MLQQHAQLFWETLDPRATSMQPGAERHAARQASTPRTPRASGGDAHNHQLRISMLYPKCKILPGVCSFMQKKNVRMWTFPFSLERASGFLVCLQFSSSESYIYFKQNLIKCFFVFLQMALLPIMWLKRNSTSQTGHASKAHSPFPHKKKEMIDGWNASHHHQSVNQLQVMKHKTTNKVVLVAAGSSRSPSTSASWLNIKTLSDFCSIISSTHHYWRAGCPSDHTIPTTLTVCWPDHLEGCTDHRDAIGVPLVHALTQTMNSGGAKRKSCEGSAHFTEEMLIQTRAQTVGMEASQRRGVWETRQFGSQPGTAHRFICRTAVLPPEEIPV